MELQGLQDIGLIRDPMTRVRAVLAMLKSSHPYDYVLSFAGVGYADVDEETHSQLRKIVDEENAKKDEWERDHPLTLDQLSFLSENQKELAKCILEDIPTPGREQERELLSAVVFRRATLPTNPHFNHALPEERVKRIEEFGVIAQSVYRDIFLVLRMDSARRDADGPHQGISTFQGDPVGQFKRDLKEREKNGIEDAITQRLRNLLPQLVKIEEEHDNKNPPCGGFEF